jgi:hypothetical protein
VGAGLNVLFPLFYKSKGEDTLVYKTSDMRKLITVLFLLAIVAGTNSINAQGVIHKLNPTDDTYTYSDNTIRGMDYNINTYHSTAGSQYRRISFLKFDISSLSRHIQTVKLRLYCNGFAAGGDKDHQFDLYPVTKNTWAEDDVTFLNFVEKVGADVTSPLLASYLVPLGQAFTAQYIEFSGANLLKYVSDSLVAGKRYISFRMREKNVVKNGTAAVIVEFHSKENPSGFAPELVVEEKNVELLKASDIQVDNVSVNGFSESKYRYTITQPWNASVVPVVSATAKYPESTVSVIQATSLTGTESNRIAKVNIQNGTDILTYSVVFELLPPPTDARLSAIIVDGKPIEFFDKDKESYTVYLPYTQTTVPVVTAQTYDPNATAQVLPANSIVATESELSRTTTLNVTSANGVETKSYRVIFHKLPELDMVLAIGQSNMSGRAPYNDVTGPMENVFLLTPAGEMEISSNPMNKYSSIRKDISVQALGPSYTCALGLENYLNKPVGFIVNAQGGSSITSWYQPGKSNYDATISRAKEAQRFGKIKAIIWHQGSSDNSAGLLDNFVSYKSRLATMVQNFRTDLNEPNLFFVLGELSERSEFDQFTATVVQPVATYITNSDFIVTDGTSLLPDGIHFDAPSAKLLGERYAEKIIQHVYNTTLNPTLKKNDFPTFRKIDEGMKVENGNNFVQYRINDVSGRMIQKGTLQPNQSTEIFLSKGVYLVSIIQNNINQTIKQIIN